MSLLFFILPALPRGAPASLRGAPAFAQDPQPGQKTFDSPVGLSQDEPLENKKSPGDQIPAASQSSDSNPLNEKIALDYVDADITTVLRSLSYTYNLNLVASMDVKGKVTISLKEVTLGEALDAILSTNGYSFTRKGNIIYISPSGTEGVQLFSEPISLKYLKAVDAQNLLRKVLSPKGDIKVDEVANMFIITDYQANIEKLKGLLKSIDQPPQQVLIEAKIVDITSKDLRNLGVTWQADYTPGHGIFGRDSVMGERIKGTSSNAGPSSSLSGGQLKIDTLILKGLTASATLDALVQDQKAHLLASPSIAVLNNREARIIIGEKVPYKERTQTTTGTTETTKFIDVGTTLRVVPSINADGYITMEIHPEVSSVTALLDAGPRITTREADTVVRVKEGETIVIGGLIKHEDNRNASRVPILGNIPILSLIFGNRSSDQTQVELAVFITPKILRSREEMLAENKTHFQEEAYVNILSVANLNVQKELFERARNLQIKSGFEPRDKEDWQRKYEALSIYENILTQFPDSPKAAEAGYQAALLYFELGEFYQARDLCARVISSYPKSLLVIKTKKLHQNVVELIEKQADKRIEAQHLREEDTRARAEAARQKAMSATLGEAAKAVRLQDELIQKEKGARQKAETQRIAREEAQREAKSQRLEKQKEAQKIAQEAKIEREQARQEAQVKAEAERRQKEKEAQEKAERKHLADEKARQKAMSATLEEAAKKEVRQKAEDERFVKQKEAREKAEEERLVKQKEAQKIVQEAKIEREQARQEAQAKAEADRRQKEEALVKAKKEKEARQKAEDERFVKQKEAREKAEEERLVKQKEAQKIAQEAKIEREQARQDAQAKAEADRRQKEEALVKAKKEKETQRAAEAQRLEKQKEAQAKAQEAKIEREQARQEAQAKAEAEHLKREEALVKAKKEKEAREKIEDERFVKQKEARQKVEEERLVKQKEAQKIAQEAKIEREQARQKAQAKAEADRRQKEKAAQEKADEKARQKAISATLKEVAKKEARQKAEDLRRKERGD